MENKVNFNNLLKAVIDASESDNWLDAVKEWGIRGCIVDSECSSECLCGKESIKYLFRIRNKHNGKELFPIGSSCINKFGRKDLKEKTAMYMELFKLLHAIESKKYVQLTSDFFSKKLLDWLFEEGAFNTTYNQFDGKDDFEFMLRMYRKRDKDAITQKQRQKIDAIIVNSIKPFLQDLLEKKIG